MREITVGKDDGGKRLDVFLKKHFPTLPPALLQKYIRTGRVKLNGQHRPHNARLAEGDELRLYIEDGRLEASAGDDAFFTRFRPNLSLVYEDENLLLADKKPGIAVHEDETEKTNTLINHIRAYLCQKGEWNPKNESAFAPALCNRIDRNTGGIVAAAKNVSALRIFTDKIKNREITKKYLCVVLGRISPAEGRLKCFLLKDEDKKRVEVYRHPVPGGKTAVTLYRTVQTRGELSLVETELVTGRTHQIRAAFAAAGHPLFGDAKYGRWEVNRRYGETRQALYSFSIRFDFSGGAGMLEYLRGREFRVERVPFAEKYFPPRA